MLSGASYEVHQHRRVASKVGLSHDKILAIYDETAKELVKRIEQRPVDACFRRSERRVGLDRVRMVGAAQRQQRSCACATTLAASASSAMKVFANFDPPDNAFIVEKPSGRGAQVTARCKRF